MQGLLQMYWLECNSLHACMFTHRSWTTIEVHCVGDRQAIYAFLYPNLMVNRYGPWMDTNIVTPTGPESCTVRFDWWLEEHLCHDSTLIEQSLADSEQVRGKITQCPCGSSCFIIQTCSRAV